MEVSRSIDKIANYKEAHEALYRKCIQVFALVKIVKPKHEDIVVERNTKAVLNKEQQLLVGKLERQYTNLVNSFIAKYQHTLSKADINLLQTNQMAISSYILMKRTGLDVTVKMYRAFYRKELIDLIKQQISIGEGVMICSKRKNGPTGKRCWQNVPLTLGIEEEYQIVSKKDKNKWDLVQGVNRILNGNDTTRAFLGKEVYKSQIEAKTEVCSNVKELAKNLLHARRALYNGLPSDLSVISSGTHPFSNWNAQVANDTARTKMFMHDMQDVVRRLVTCGLHIHVGVEDKELAIKIMNSVRQFLPLMLALSSNSPFWEGRMTGLMSYRSTVFSSLPRTGIPPEFRDYHEYQNYIDLMCKTKAFDSAGTNDARKIWWDVRVHPLYPTIEFRIFDACCHVRDSICMAAMCQAVVAKIAKLIHDGKELQLQKKHIIEENKWRAIRYGRRATFIDEKSSWLVTTAYKCLELMDFVDDVIPALGSKSELAQILEISRNGGGADGQLKIFQSKGNLKSVVEWLSEEFVK